MAAARPHVRFLLGTADGANGVARSVFNTARFLAADYDVEVIGLFQRRTTPVYEVPAGVRLWFLEDLRDDGAPRGRLSRRLAAMRSRLIERPGPRQYPGCSLLTDLLLLKALASMRSGVLVTTRPELHLVAARFAPRRLVVVAQEHMNYLQRPADLREAVAKRAGRTDAMVVLTERDRQDYVSEAEWPASKVHCIPNSMPWPLATSGPSGNQVVIAAGRLNRQKGFDRLIEAFAPVARAHPGWELRIYGQGKERAALQAMIDELQIGSQTRLMGWTDSLGDAMSEASVFAMTSRFEGLPLVGIEAMSRGLPMVSFDCPRGPRELVKDGTNGFLVPNGDIPAFTAALSQVIDDDELRASMSKAALRDAEVYEISSVGRRWKELIEGLLSAAGQRG